MSLQDAALKLKVVSANSFTRTTRAVASIGILAAIIVPFLLFTMGGRGSSNMPWYIWTIMLLLLLLGIGMGRYRFLLDSQEAAAMSIRPNHR
jgi:hypothetical protein